MRKVQPRRDTFSFSPEIYSRRESTERDDPKTFKLSPYTGGEILLKSLLLRESLGIYMDVRVRQNEYLYNELVSRFRF